jgi:hypothetical protein
VDVEWRNLHLDAGHAGASAGSGNLTMLFADPLSGRVDEFGGYDGRFYQMTTWRWRSGDWHKLCSRAFSLGARGGCDWHRSRA